MGQAGLPAAAADGDHRRRDYRGQESRRSRSRGDEDGRARRDYRAQERDYRARRSRSREAQSRAPPMESRTIQITGGVVATRLWLKKEMERFGRVEVCHTGNRQNPIGEPPWVRFATLTQAESALEAINGGQVLIDGCTIQAQFKSSRPPPPPQRTAPVPRRSERDMDITSRDIAQQLRNRRRRSSSSSSSSRKRGPR